MQKQDLEKAFEPVLKAAIEEDIASGDITTEAIIPPDAMGYAYIEAKEDLILCGTSVVEQCFRYPDDGIVSITHNEKDGNEVKRGTVVIEINATLHRLLSRERIALNILQRLSGIASKTHSFVERLKGSKVKLLDTRKTIPGMRLLEKYAVQCGGGTNHRMGLWDCYLIKDNHIKAAGGIREAIRKVRGHNDKKYMVEVECTTMEEIEEAIKELPDVIMLDNMDDLTIKKAIRLIDKKAKIEVSGNVSQGRIPNLARMEIDFISTGAVTHSVTARDFSMNIRS